MHPPIEETIEIAPELKNQIHVFEEKQVIVHITMKPVSNPFYRIRLWPTIYLIPEDTHKKSNLIQSFNISLFPAWQPLPIGIAYRFTLVFESLPQTCTHFSLQEIIPEAGGFYVSNISRNESDVYEVEV